MVIFELPATRHCGELRAVSLGSCRVRNPLQVLRDRGDLRIRAESPTPTHTAAEAVQSLAVALGERSIPEGLNPFVYESDHRGSAARLSEALAEGVDVFLLEISDDKQFSFRDVCLNQNFVSRQLVQASRGALLEWYRELGRSGSIQEASAAAALAKLRQNGIEPDSTIIDLIRELRLDRCPPDEITDALRTVMAKMGGRWVVVGPFTTPGAEGTIMKRRREFNDVLRKASVECGALFYDPSALICAHGKEKALAGAGTDIYEYEPSFYPTLGETLIGLVRSVGPPGGRDPWLGSSDPTGRRTAFPSDGSRRGKTVQTLRRRAARLGRGLRNLLRGGPKRD